MSEKDLSDVGERLATWLEELGLVAHLAAAGLPTLQRDPSGRAVWTDPKTGDELDADQLSQLDGLLHHEGSDPTHAVPVPLLLIARQARLREALLTTPWFTYETLAERRGTPVNTTRFAVHKAADTHRLLVLTTEAGVIVPGFQLGDDGHVRAELAPVVETLLTAGMDPWRAWAWLTQPAGLLAGMVPEQAVRDREEAPIVLHAALRLGERVSAAKR